MFNKMPVTERLAVGPDYWARQNNSRRSVIDRPAVSPERVELLPVSVSPGELKLAAPPTPVLVAREADFRERRQDGENISQVSIAEVVCVRSLAHKGDLDGAIRARFFVDKLLSSAQNPKSRFSPWWRLLSLERTMYALVTQLKSRRTLTTEAVCFSIALVTAEVFFKFHSFVLECSAFLLLWFCLGSIGSFLVGRREKVPPV
jgi:hypothetical protein